MSGALELLAFAGVMALGQFSPGPDMILLTRTALREGAGAGVTMAWGIACGLVVHAGIAFAGLALVLQRQGGVGDLVRWAAAGYLMWLVYQIAFEHFGAVYSGGKREELLISKAGKPFLRGLTCNLLNPKVAIFLAAVSTPFLTANHPDWWPLALGGIVVIQGGVLWSLWASLLQWKPLKKIYQRLERWLDGFFAMVLLGLAIYLIVG